MAYLKFTFVLILFFHLGAASAALITASPDDVPLGIDATFSFEGFNLTATGRAGAASGIEQWGVSTGFANSQVQRRVFTHTNSNSFFWGNTAGRARLFVELDTPATSVTVEFISPFSSNSGYPVEIDAFAPDGSFLGKAIAPQGFPKGASVFVTFDAPGSEVIGLFTAWSGTAANANTYIGNISANTIPIPAAAWLFGSALGLLGWIRRLYA